MTRLETARTYYVSDPAVISGYLGFVGDLALLTVDAAEEKVHCLAINSAVANHTRVSLRA